MRWSLISDGYGSRRWLPKPNGSEHPKRGGDQPKDLSRQTTESEDGHRQMGEGNR
jgi:hypothetical protein